ncbi:MAG: HAD-IIIA family hydrolase [Bacteroidales bacterium]|nr:HAD-IIIA family hydrolase [Bacteroidales bacterium]
MTNYKAQLKKVKTFIFDYDGVLTEGTIIMTEQGEALRISNIKDGYALQLAVKMGYRIAIISGARSKSMEHRLKALQITDVFLGVGNKLETFHTYLRSNSIDPSEVLFMGDDIPDYQIMREVGMPTCPADAAEEIKKMARYISHVPGGKGCVRDVIEQVMKVQGKWMTDDAFFW